tara:strand:- start:37 stop:1287 length:1251 start_codon:yes stop_codon:yes gene_type:complete
MKIVPEGLNFDSNKKNIKSFMFFSCSSCTFLYFYPILFCYFIALISFVKLPRSFNILFGIIISFVFSLLVASRDSLTGIEKGGFGSDIINYKNAFNSILELEAFNLSDILQISVNQTGSGEPLFWGLVYILSLIVQNPDMLWFLITFIFLSIFSVYTASSRLYGSLQVLIILCSTITFYIYFSSVIRQGVAFLIVYISVNEFYKGRLKRSYFLILLAALCHYSAIVIAISLYFGNRLKGFHIGNTSKILTYGIVIFILGLVLLQITPYLPSDLNLAYKLQARLSNTAVQTSFWEIQFFSEIIIFFIIVKCFSISVPKKIIASLVVFCFLVVLCIPMAGIADRLYRYTYVFYLFSYSHWLNERDKSAVVQLIQPFIIILFFIWFCILFSTRYDQIFFEKDLGDILSTNLTEMSVFVF